MAQGPGAVAKVGSCLAKGDECQLPLRRNRRQRRPLRPQDQRNHWFNCDFESWSATDRRKWPRDSPRTKSITSPREQRNTVAIQCLCVLLSCILFDFSTLALRGCDVKTDDLPLCMFVAMDSHLYLEFLRQLRSPSILSYMAYKLR